MTRDLPPGQHRDAFLKLQRRDQEVTATRTLDRLAAYTPRKPAADPSPTSEEERPRLCEQLLGDTPGQTDTHRPANPHPHTH